MNVIRKSCPHLEWWIRPACRVLEVESRLQIGFVVAWASPRLALSFLLDLCCLQAAAALSVRRPFQGWPSGRKVWAGDLFPLISARHLTSYRLFSAYWVFFLRQGLVVFLPDAGFRLHRLGSALSGW